MSETRFINPFGTQLLKTTVPTEIFEQITLLVNQIRPNLDNEEFLKQASFSDYLAGKNSYQIRLPNNFGSYTGLDNYIIDLSHTFVSEFNVPAKNLIMGNSWINFSYSGDFNPIHTHDSLLSGIIYIKQDIAIEEEAKNNKNWRSQGSLPGGTNFVYDLNGNRTFTRSEYINQFDQQTLILFPSWLTHYVNPFKSDSERITLAFNVLAVENN